MAAECAINWNVSDIYQNFPTAHVRTFVLIFRLVVCPTRCRYPCTRCVVLEPKSLSSLLTQIWRLIDSHQSSRYPAYWLKLTSIIPLFVKFTDPTTSTACALDMESKKTEQTKRKERKTPVWVKVNWHSNKRDLDRVHKDKCIQSCLEIEQIFSFRKLLSLS